MSKHTIAGDFAEHLVAEVEAIAAEFPAGSPALREKAVAYLKTVHADGQADADLQLQTEGGGRRIATQLRRLQDAIIIALHTLATRHLYRQDNPSAAERMAVVATGGYGRGLLAPGSDIDLLFLLPYKQTAWGESVAEAMLYALWDMGLKVGHATRSVEECIRHAKADMTIRTALLDARLVVGDAGLFREFEARFDKDVVQGTAAEFVAAKLAERDERHRRAGQSRYLVEPNVKDGKGGLRDLDTLFWMAKYVYRVSSIEAFVEAGLFSKAEGAAFLRCSEYLWTVRCNLHFLSKRAEERLGFDVQREMAVRLGYTQHPGQRDVERFMKHYFLIAREVGELTAIVCSALEEREARKPQPMLSRMMARIRPGARRKTFKESDDFAVEGMRIVAADDGVFERDPLNLIRMFHLADLYELNFHPHALRLAHRSLKRIDERLRSDKEANRLFLEILTSRRDPERILRKMNESGVLGRFVTEFGHVVAMMQFNMYHHYTVDEHLLRCIGIFGKVEKGVHPDPGLAADLAPQLANRRALIVALFLHDIAKGRPEDHSKAGARIARKLCPRFGLTPAETELVAWLVQEHLTMSTIAQSRDISDRKTIENFAAVVQGVERMKMLLVLTTVDIKAVGPGVWNGWKSQLLKSLYYETEPTLTGGFSEVNRGRRVILAQEEFRAALKGWPEEEADRYVARHYPAYWLKVDLARKLEHAAFLRDADRRNQRLATIAKAKPTGITELTVLAPDHPRVLATIAGACAASGANIVDAQIYTTTDGLALDSISITRELERDEDEQRRAQRIAETIEKALEGRFKMTEAVAAKRAVKGRIKAFHVEPEVGLNNSWSNRYTMIEVSGLDRPGLLFDLTTRLSDLSLNIASAHVATFGERAVDVFYVTDLMGAKIESPQRQMAIRKALMGAFAADERKPVPGRLKTRASG